MKHKSTLVAAVALFSSFTAVCTVHNPPSAHAQTPKTAPILGKTFLEGMALDEESEPLYKYQNPMTLTGLYYISIKHRAGEEVVKQAFPSDLGGLYRIELKPGVYDIFIGRDLPGGVTPKFTLRPMRINGVTIKGGKINKLDITLHKGEMLETIGEPVETTLPAIVLSEMLDKLQKQVDALTKENEALKARLDKLEKK